MERIEAASASTTMQASKDDVWAALTTPELLKQYFFGADVKSTWLPGEPITFSGSYEGKAYEDKGVILESERNRILSFTHWSALSGAPDTPENYHVVTISLDGRDGETGVRLTQENQNGAAVSAESRQQLEKNWNMMLGGLKKTVESRRSSTAAPRR